MDTTTNRTAHGRDRRIRQTSRPDLPGRTSGKHPALRLAFAVAVLAGGMGVGLWAAKTYLLKDWSARVAEAKRSTLPQTQGQGEASAEQEGRSWAAHGTARTMKRLSWPGSGRIRVNAWLVCARGLDDARLASKALSLAQATGVSEGTIHNERGVAALQAGQTLQAYRWFGLALEADPGSAPALRNRALCAARLHLDGEALAAAAAYLGRNPRDAAMLRLAAALLCQRGRAAAAQELLERELAAGGDKRLYLDAAELAMRNGAGETALRYLDAAVEGNIPLADVAQTYKGPLFDEMRGTPGGRAFTQRLAARARALLDAAADGTGRMPLPRAVRF